MSTFTSFINRVLPLCMRVWPGDVFTHQIPEYTSAVWQWVGGRAREASAVNHRIVNLEQCKNNARVPYRPGMCENLATSRIALIEKKNTNFILKCFSCNQSECVYVGWGAVCLFAAVGLHLSLLEYLCVFANKKLSYLLIEVFWAIKLRRHHLNNANGLPAAAARGGKILYSRETHRRRALILLLPLSRNTASLSRVCLWAYFIQRNTNRALSLSHSLAVCSSIFGIAGK